MTFDQNELIDDLVARCQKGQEGLERMKTASLESLNYKEDEKTWSVLECIEHLNRYGRFYLPEIDRRMQKGKDLKTTGSFKSGVLGNYFAKSVSPKETLNTMNTFSNMNPNNSDLGMETLEEFEGQLTEMIGLLEAARHLSLKRIKTAISISKVIKLRLGDTFRVVIYHNDRHLVQAKKALNLATSRAE